MTIRPKSPNRSSPRDPEQPRWPVLSSNTSAVAQRSTVSRDPDARTAQSVGSGNRITVFSKRSGARAAGFADLNKGKQQKLLLHIRLETSPQLLQQVGDFVGAYSKYRFQPRTAERIALASYELIENGVSYGSVSGDVIYSLAETERYVEIRVENDSSAGRLTNLRAQLERIRVDPEKAFLDEMGRSVTGAGGRANLGLARICHEGQMDLEFEVDGNRVSMCARCSR